MIVAKEKRIVATGFAVVGTTGSPSVSLAPNEYVVFDEDNEAHKAIAAELEAGRESGLEIREVDTDKEQAAAEAAQQNSDEAAQAAARAMTEEVRRAQIQAGEGIFNPEENTVAQTLEYLRQASPEEVERVQGLEASSDRNSKQIADYEPKAS